MPPPLDGSGTDGVGCTVAYLAAMPVCPRCHDEYVDGVATCRSCGLALVPEGEALPPQVDLLLGVFHPIAAEPVVRVLRHRGIAHDALPADHDRVEIVVDRAFRDDLRAELAINWSNLIGSLERDDMYTVLEAGGIQPGWFDAPQGAWIDREGRLQVEAASHEADEEEARRVFGPMLLALGAITTLFGWYADASDVFVLLGVLALSVGVFLPR